MTGAQLIAQGVTSTRKLEGFLKQLYATTTLMHRQISPEAISEQLRKMGNEDIVKSKRPYTRPIEILKVISKHFNVTESQIIGPKRLRPIVIPRQYAMYLMRVDLEISYKEIGRILGGRDHTTVMYAVEKISKEVNLSEVKQQEISTLRKQIYG
jgi:chromosomal replication initiator protein